MNAQPLALPCYSTLGRQVRPGLTGPEMEAALKAAGYTYLGSGISATAYLSPDKSRVVKLHRGGNKGAQATLETALENPDNPHLPKVYGVLDLGDGDFAVECEPLEPMEGRAAHDSNDRYRSWRAAWSPRHWTIEEIEARPDSAMKAALLALKANADRYCGEADYFWDTHGGNVLRRPSDNALVLNDLIA